MKAVINNLTHGGVNTDITVENRKTASVGKSLKSGIAMQGLKVYPGLIDIHSHGAVGVDVMDGKAYTDYGATAGSTTNLFDCVKCAVSFGIPEEDAVKMAAETPARLMKLNKGVVAEGYDADLIFVDDNFELRGVMVREEMQ